MWSFNGNRPPRAVRIVAIVALWLIILSAAVMYLWNALLPGLFGWRTLSFGEAMGLLVLCKILFGNWRGGGWGQHWRQQQWSHYYERLTPEERERMREKFAGRGWFNRWGAEPMDKTDPHSNSDRRGRY